MSFIPRCHYFLKMNNVKVVTNLLRFLVVISISSAILVVFHRSPCSYRPILSAHREEEPAPVLVVGRRNNGTTHHVAAPAAASSSSDDDDDNDKLSELLSRAAMEDSKTVIMAITNEAWTRGPDSLTDLFLESFHEGVNTEALLKHLLIVTVDTKAQEWCQRAHPRLCYALDVGGANLTSEQPYMSMEYLDMVWCKVRLQGRVLELGYSFLLTDVDVAWFRSPLLRVPVAADMAMACDRFRGGDKPYDLEKDANAGLVYARASKRMAEFYRVWYRARSLFPGQKTQDVFEKIKHQVTTRLGVTLQFVDTAYFGTFCDDGQKMQWDFNKLCTFHANCIVGLSNKVHTLRAVLDEWKQFKAASSNNGTTPIRY